MDVSFLTPVGGATSLVVIIAALAALAREHRASRLREAIGLRSPGRLARLPSFLAVLAVGLLALAAAQPVIARVDTHRARSDAEVVFLLDRSRSMLAAPAPTAPTRFSRAVDLASALRAALADVPAGVASIGREAAPHLFPSTDRAAFELVATRGLGVEHPPPVGSREVLATDLEEIGDVAADGYFSPEARRRLVVALTDAESEPFSPADVADELRRDDVRLVVVRIGSARERIYGDAGVPERYRPDERAGADVARLALELGGRIYGEGEREAAIGAARRLLGVGPAVVVGEEKRTVPLAPYAVAAAAIVLAALFLSPRALRVRR